MSKDLISLKAQMLCEGVNADSEAVELFRQQNPSNVKRGGLSSGGKMILEDQLPVNAPFYKNQQVPVSLTVDPERERGVSVLKYGQKIANATVIEAPSWYREKVGDFDITQVLTAHNRQLAASVYEGCALFDKGEECQFCVINRSLANKDPRLVLKSPELFLQALGKIPLNDYAGLTLNGGMTRASGRGMELIEPVVRAVKEVYPDLNIAVEITPPEDLNWIDKMADAGLSSLMMNLECFDPELRSKLVPGKNKYCPPEMYFKAFERAIKLLGPGVVSTCFVVGTEPIESLMVGIRKVIEKGVIPSPLAGRYFEDVPGYPFKASVDYNDFLKVMSYARMQMFENGLISCDKAGCVGCRMCDLIMDSYDNNL